MLADALKYASSIVRLIEGNTLVTMFVMNIQIFF